MFFIRPSVSVSIRKKARETRQTLSSINSYSLKDVYNNGTNMHTIRLTSESLNSNNNHKLSGFLSSRVKSNHKNKQFDSRLKQDIYFKKIKSDEFTYKDVFIRLVMPGVICIVLIMFTIISLIYCKKQQVYLSLLGKTRAPVTEPTQPNKFDLFKFAKFKLSLQNQQAELINTSGENYSGSNSSSDTMVVVSSQVIDNCNLQQGNSYVNKQDSRLQILKSKMSNEDSNMTFQTLISSTTAGTPVNLNGSSTISNNNFNTNLILNGYSPSDKNDDDHYMYANSTPTNRRVLGEIEDEEGSKPAKSPSTLRGLLKKVSFFKSKRVNKSKILRKHESFNTSNEDYEDLTRNFIESNHNRQFMNMNQDIGSMSSNTNNFHKYPTIKRNNYLYFNYNNNKMNYFNNSPDLSSEMMINDHDLANELHSLNHGPVSTKLVITTTPMMTTETMAALASISSSTPTQITPVSSTTKCSIGNANLKRLSGTEV